MDQVKSLVKDHLEKHKFFDTLKSAVAKDPKLASLDRNAIIERLKNEGILSEILQQLPAKQLTVDQSAKQQAFESRSKDKAGSSAKLFHRDNLDPKKRYLAVKVVQTKAFVDFINARDDEFLSISVSFLKQRFQTQQVYASTDATFEETFIFEFVGENDNIKFDPSMLMKLNQLIHITVLKQRKNEKA
jgi:hypothetical protein